MVETLPSDVVYLMMGYSFGIVGVGDVLLVVAVS